MPKCVCCLMCIPSLKKFPLLPFLASFQFTACSDSFPELPLSFSQFESPNRMLLLFVQEQGGGSGGEHLLHLLVELLQIKEGIAFGWVGRYEKSREKRQNDAKN